MWIDTHAHLTSKAFDEDRDAVIDRAKAAGVGRILCIGDSVEASAAATRLAQEREEVWASVGIHPHEAARAPEDIYEALAPLLDHPKVCALGEIGLDYHYDFSPAHVQHRVFREQIRIAKRVGLPLVVHNRESDDDVIRILREEDAGEVGGVLHCFWGSEQTAKAALDMGFYLGVGGPITFKNANELRALLSAMPLERLIVETDAPYLAPVPFRGKRNEPAYVVESGKALAGLLGLEVAELADVTTRNAHALFRFGLR